MSEFVAPLNSAWILMASLAFTTLISEDLASAAAGALVAEGRLGFLAATAACFGGIVAGDLLLFAAGRLVGRRVLEWPLVRRFVPTDAVNRSSAWLDRRGAMVVLLSRFTPGTRLPTCLAAGILGSDPKRFVAWFLLAAAIWTPTVVVFSAAAGRQLTGVNPVVMILLVLASFHIVNALRRWSVRRRLYGLWQRVTRWEFWPMWVLYVPVLARIVVLMLQHRGVTVFTAANPGIPGGGFAGESKFAILRALSATGELVARAALLPAADTPEQRVRAARRFLDHANVPFPVVLKPDTGQRGAGVRILHSMEALEHAIRESTTDLILQEYAPGEEFGVFYVRRPGQSRGRIFSMTEKRFLSVTGDGRRTLEELILADGRAVCLERLHRRTHRNRLREIPPAGGSVQLVEIGSHCRGAVFLDAMHLLTPHLEAAFDEIAKGFAGFYFGRFDVRTPAVEEFRQGRNFRIVELNGVTSEATHIYDPSNGVFAAWRVLFAQWRLAFEIGAANIERGAVPAALPALLAMILYAFGGQGRKAAPPPRLIWEYEYDDRAL